MFIKATDRGAGCLSLDGHAKAAAHTDGMCAVRFVGHLPISSLSSDRFAGSRQPGTDTGYRLGRPAQRCYIKCSLGRPAQWCYMKCSGNDSVSAFACVQEQQGVGPPQSMVHSGAQWRELGPGWRQIGATPTDLSLRIQGVGATSVNGTQRGNSGGDWGLDGDKEGPR